NYFYLNTLFCFVLFETGGFHFVVQAGLELTITCHAPASASQSSGLTGIHHHTR
ncbi:hypothetical protein GW7_19100, partial [Heterocephalus glaber]